RFLYSKYADAHTNADALSLSWFQPPVFYSCSFLINFGFLINCLGLIKERRDKLTGVKKPQVIRLFPGSHPDHGQTQLVGDCQHNAAPGGAVEPGQDDAVDPNGFLKDPRLVEAVLAGTRIQDQQGKEVPVPQVAGAYPVNFL